MPLFKFTALEYLKMMHPDVDQADDYCPEIKLSERCKEHLVALMQKRSEVWGGKVPLVMLEKSEKPRKL
jgi:hypothetical protein